MASPGHDRAEAANGHLSCPMVRTPPIRKESPADGRGLCSGSRRELRDCSFAWRNSAWRPDDNSEKGHGQLVSPSHSIKCPSSAPVHRHRSILIALPACVKELHRLASRKIVKSLSQLVLVGVASPWGPVQQESWEQQKQSPVVWHFCTALSGNGAHISSTRGLGFRGEW